MSCGVIGELYAILMEIPRAIHHNYVFTLNGRAIGRDITKSLKKACARAGIPHGRYTKNGITFHDLRHTFNTNMRKAGVPESVIMEISGRSTRAMFDRHNTVDTEDRREAVKKLGLYLPNVTHLVTHAVRHEEI